MLCEGLLRIATFKKLKKLKFYSGNHIINLLKPSLLNIINDSIPNDYLFVLCREYVWRKKIKNSSIFPNILLTFGFSTCNFIISLISKITTKND